MKAQGNKVKNKTMPQKNTDLTKTVQGSLIPKPVRTQV